MTTPSIVTPSQPDSTMIQLIHRGHDGYVTFGHKVKGEGTSELTYKNIASIPARALPGLFDQMIPLLEYDGYFGVNGMWKPGHVSNEYGLFDESGKPLTKAWNKVVNLRWLTAIYTDLDCHKLGMEPIDVVGEILRLQEDDKIPPASIITRSGGGVWLFWLLTGKDSMGPLRAWPEHIAAWNRIQQAFNIKFADFGADPNAIAANEITRAPGSINTKRQFKRVGYWPQLDPDGLPFLYSLEQLAAWCGVSLETRQHQRLPSPIGKGKDPKAVAKGVKGQAGRWKVAADNFRLLWRLRGTWRVGLRNAATMQWATILYSHPASAELTDERITEELNALFDDMEQPANETYSRAEFKDTIATARARADQIKKFSMSRLASTRNQTIADKLEITPEEVSLCKAMGRFTWPASKKYPPADEQPALTQSQVRERRRVLLKHHMVNRQAAGETMPPLPVLAELVEMAGLPRPSDQTVANDLDALGHVNHRKRRPRNPDKNYPQKLFD